MHYYILILIILNHYKKKENKTKQKTRRTTYNGDNFQIFDIPNNKGKKPESWTDKWVKFEFVLAHY